MTLQDVRQAQISTRTQVHRDDRGFTYVHLSGVAENKTHMIQYPVFSGIGLGFRDAPRIDVDSNRADAECFCGRHYNAAVAATQVVKYVTGFDGCQIQHGLHYLGW